MLNRYRAKLISKLTVNNFQYFKNVLNSISFLTEEDCKLFENELIEKKYDRGDYVLTEGKVCRYLGFVSKGLFRVYYLKDGKEINTRFISENNYVVDYRSFLQQNASRYFIEALEPADLIVFTLSALQRAYEKSQGWEKYGRIIAEQSYLETTKRVESFMFMDAKERYKMFMNEHPEYIQRIPLYHIASYLGIERESLSRIRKEIL
jgi:CRP-like cAMP-binding protein